jgi:pullulanase
MLGFAKKIHFIIGLFLTANFTMIQKSKMNTIQYTPFDDYPVYLKNDLGVVYSADKTVIKLWSPNVEEAKINLYK